MTRRKIALTGFMGVGKSSVARHLSSMLGMERIDLDRAIEKSDGRTIAQIIDADGIERYRRLESSMLESTIADFPFHILSLGGGTWTQENNRKLLSAAGYSTIWLEATFEHCWLNISFSKKERPLARDKAAAMRLFDERQMIYALAEWRIAVRPGSTSKDVARRIKEEIFS